jgi:uncharacterized RDD family membrane protein YckC
VLGPTGLEERLKSAAEGVALFPSNAQLGDYRAVVENDPYQPPAAELRAPVQLGPEGEALASRESRLGAAIIDGIIIMAIMMPALWMMGLYDDPAGESSMALTAAASGGGFLLTLLIQGYFLATRAQSIGKMALKIKIVTLDGKNAGLARILLLRMLPISLVSVIPLIGSFVGIADTLFIFRADQRCVHDLIAGTRVVKA